MPTEVQSYETVQSAARLAPPWTGIFHAAARDTQTAADLIRTAKLNWNVQEEPLYLASGRPVSTHKAIVRMDTKSVLGVVGHKYEVLQNAESFAFVDTLVQQTQSVYAGAGTFDGGKSLYIQVRLDKGYEIVKDDVVWPYFVFGNAHDGSGGIHCGMSITRIVCSNTKRIAFKEGKKSQQAVSIRHTKNMRDRLEASTRILGMAAASQQVFVSNAQRLAATNVANEKALRQYYLEVLGADAESLGQKKGRTSGKIDRLVELFDVGAGNDLPGARGTWWAAFNAVTQYANHEAPTAVRGSQDMTESAKAAATRARRLASVFEGSSADLMDSAMDLALEAAQ